MVQFEPTSEFSSIITPLPITVFSPMITPLPIETFSPKITPFFIVAFLEILLLEASKWFPGDMRPRQKLPKVYIRSGSFYLIKKNKFLKYKSLVGEKTGYVILKNIYSLNIDSIEDLIIFKNFYK